MDLDATLNSHPIVQPVDHPDQITELFDKITYHKGASVLRMLENFMGPENFRLGIKRFLQKYSYQTAVTAQLWTELESVVDLNVTRIMDTYVSSIAIQLSFLKSKVTSNKITSYFHKGLMCQNGEIELYTSN